MRIDSRLIHGGAAPPYGLIAGWDVISRFQSQPPVDVEGIANAMGVNVWESGSLGSDVSGKLFRDPINGGSSGYSILVNSADAFTRKRFTVAHEIAHFMLHRDLVGDITDDTFYRSSLTNAQETAANKLAAEILMPYLLIQSVIESGTNGIKALATIFQVSESAMKIRLGIPIP